MWKEVNYLEQIVFFMVGRKPIMAEGKLIIMGEKPNIAGEFSIQSYMIKYILRFFKTLSVRHNLFLSFFLFCIYFMSLSYLYIPLSLGRRSNLCNFTIFIQKIC